MSLAILRAPLDLPSLGLIWLYQRFLSPRKGYRCAHSLLHGDTGCSGYAKHSIRDHGLISAIPLIRQRFRDCETSAVTLRSNREEERRKSRNEHKSDACFCAGEGCASGADVFACCRSAPRGSGKSGGCDGQDYCSGADACSCTPW